MSENLPYSDRLRLIKLGLLPKEAVAKKKQPIKKVSDKKKAELEAEKKERGGEETELTKWFRHKVKISSGVCAECGCKVETNVFKYAVMTVAHLLPKRDNMCPSVKTHPLNYIILCPDHHHQYDNSTWEEKEKMGCWPVIQERLIMIYPDLHPSERRHFPESVLRYMEKKEPFRNIEEDSIPIFNKNGGLSDEYIEQSKIIENFFIKLKK